MDKYFKIEKVATIRRLFSLLVDLGKLGSQAAKPRKKQVFREVTLTLNTIFICF